MAEDWKPGILDELGTLEDGTRVWEFIRKPDVCWMTSIEPGYLLMDRPGPSIMHTDGRLVPWSVWTTDLSGHCGILAEWAEELFQIDAEAAVAELLEDVGGRLPD